MKLTACFLLLSAGVYSATPADEPPSPATQPPAVQAPAAQATAATPTPKADKSEVVNAAATEAEIMQLRSFGYKQVNRNGALVFCRDEGESGSHFQRTHCSTLKQLQDAELSRKEYVKEHSLQGYRAHVAGEH